MLKKSLSVNGVQAVLVWKGGGRGVSAAHAASAATAGNRASANRAGAAGAAASAAANATTDRSFSLQPTHSTDTDNDAHSSSSPALPIPPSTSSTSSPPSAGIHLDSARPPSPGKGVLKKGKATANFRVTRRGSPRGQRVSFSEVAVLLSTGSEAQQVGLKTGEEEESAESLIAQKIRAAKAMAPGRPGGAKQGGLSPGGVMQGYGEGKMVARSVPRAFAYSQEEARVGGGGGVREEGAGTRGGGGGVSAARTGWAIPPSSPIHGMREYKDGH